MLISLAVEESSMRECGPKEVEDEEGLSQSGETEGEVEEEGRTAVGRKRPNIPTTIEQEEHARTHCPYRSWCRHCVKSRARNSPHGAGVLRAKGEGYMLAVPEHRGMGMAEAVGIVRWRIAGGWSISRMSTK